MEQMVVHKDGMPIYPIIMQESFGALPLAMEPLNIDNRKVCIITDTNVEKLYLAELAAILEAEAKAVSTYVIPAGEQYKTLDSVKNIYEHLIIEKFDRKDMLIALGGGVIGDMTGYTAATYLRGIDFVQIPTTLLSQVDSSIGGKTGVDFDSYKNMVGAFYQPRLVYMNLAVLKTLSKAQFASGMGEVIKHSFIKSETYCCWIKENREAISKRELGVLKEMIKKSCEIKKNVVENDPHEKGERALLNFGHTIGHAVEKLKDFQQLHGECVAIGMAAAIYLSVKRGYLTSEQQKEMEEMLQSFELPVKVEGLEADDIIQVMQSDKKVQAGKLKFILLRERGQAFICEDLKPDDYVESIRYIEREM